MTAYSKRVGGIRFIGIGRLRFSYCIARPAPYRPGPSRTRDALLVIWTLALFDA
jgi:hypothetical protein